MYWESRKHSKRQQSEPHPEDTVMLNDADPEEEDEQGAGRGEDDVSSSRREVRETDEAEECDTETSSQPACNGTYPLTNRK